MPQPAASSAPAPSPRTVVWLGGVLVLAAAAVYANGLTGPFVYDDRAAILENPSLEHLSNLGAVLHPPPEGLTVAGRPVLNLSFALNHAIGGTRVFGYHVANVLIHALAGLALFGLVRRTFLRPVCRAHVGSARAATFLAFAVALLWTVHPLQTEAVSYTVQRAESLMSLFYLLTLYCALRAMEDNTGDDTAARRRTLAWQAASFAACLLGMATKENMVSAPVLVLLLDRTFFAGTFAAAWRQRWRFYASLAATWLLLAALVVSTGGDRGGSAGFDVGVSWWAYFLTQFPALVRYLALSFWPHPLVFDYGTFWIGHVSDVALEALVVIALAAGALFALRRRSALAVPALLAFAILAPTSLMPGTTQMIVEHRMYLPLAGVLAIAVPAIYLLVGRRAIVAGLALAAGLGLLTARRNLDYRSEISIWRDTAAKSPASANGHHGFGAALARAGRRTEAVAEYETALRLRPGYVDALVNLGDVLTQLGRTTEAIDRLGEAVRLKPASPEANLNLGVALTEANRPDEALPCFARAVQLKPRFPEALNALGAALARRGDYPAALARLTEAIRLRPDYAFAHYTLATVLLRTGRAADAAAEFALGRSLAPDDPKAIVAWAGALLATGRVDDAIAQYEAALKLQPDFVDARYNLGNAYAATGRFADAARAYERALQLNPAYAEAHNNLGNALVALDRVAEAIPHYETALRLKPANPNAHNNLGLALARSGRLRDAAAQFAEAVREAPDYQEAKTNLARAQADLAGAASTTD